MSSTSKLRIAIIGCGPSGMATLVAFSQAQAKGVVIPEIVCFEKQEKIGGLWNYTWRTGTDEFGESVHGGMYQHMWTNAPNECHEMADYTFPEHFGKALPSFVPREVLHDYLMGKAKKFEISKFNIQFNTVVRHVKEDGEHFLVTALNLKTQESSTEVFDYVVVATGHFSVPNVPSYTGIENFSGRVMHSHDFRNAAEYKGRTLLLVGNHLSGEDIAMQCIKYGAKECILSYRSVCRDYKWPEGVREVSQLTKFENGLFHFKDGSSCSADVLIFCTGYLNHYPFLPDNIRLRTDNSLYPDNLYKGIVYKNNKRVLYIGSQNQYYTCTLFDTQAHWLRDYILGNNDQKNDSEKADDIKTWRDKMLAIKDAHEAIDFQTSYMRDLMNYTDYPEYGLEKRADIFKVWASYRDDNIATYRNRSFTSTITGIASPIYPIAWMEAMDDTLQGFLKGVPCVNGFHN